MKITLHKYEWQTTLKYFFKLHFGECFSIFINSLLKVIAIRVSSVNNSTKILTKDSAVSCQSK